MEPRFISAEGVQLDGDAAALAWASMEPRFISAEGGVPQEKAFLTGTGLQWSRALSARKAIGENRARPC